MPPDWNDYVRRHLPALGLRPEREIEITAELAEQMQQAYQEWLALGHSEREAIQQGEGQVRDWEALARELRDSEAASPGSVELEGGASWFDALWCDVRYAIRGLGTHLAFAVSAIATLAFAIGGNTAIFTVVDHIALRGLPYPNASRLISLEQTRVDEPALESWLAIDNMLDFRRSTQGIESMAGISPIWNVVMTGEGEAERLEALYVSADFFPMLATKPLIGRLFTDADDDRTRTAPVVVLSYSFWKRRFGASPSVLGKPLRLDGQTAQVAGVLPEDFRWVGEPLPGTATDIDVWMPLATNQLAKSPRTLRFLKVLALVRPGVTMEQGLDEVRRVGSALTQQFPDANKNLVFSGVPLDRKIFSRLRPAVYLLLATIGFFLLMASANVANLLLARTANRKQELSVRVALGASARRLARQLLTESAVLAMFGGLLGIVMAHLFLRLILEYGPPAIVNTMPIAIDWRAVGFTGAVSLLTAVLCGVGPAWRTIAGWNAGTLRQGRGVTRGNRRLRSVLVMAQVGLAAILLSGSGLLVRSLLRVLVLDPGFNPRNVVSISTQMPLGVTSAAQRTNVYNKIHDDLLAAPGVKSVSAVSRLPMLAQSLTSLLLIEGLGSTGHPPEVEFRAAAPDYFSTMGIPLLTGRLFDDRDGPSQRNLLIDDVTARRYFPNVDPLGKRIKFLSDSDGPWFTVIGVVGATRHFGLEAVPRPTIYRPVIINPLFAPVFVVRTVNDPAPMIPTLSSIVRNAYGNMPAYNVYEMKGLVEQSTAERRFLMWLMTSFAIAALALASIDIYGAISQSMTQRTQEIGVRIALGAAPADIMRFVFGEAAGMVVGGIVLGGALGMALAKTGEHLLFGVQPYDPLVFLATAAMLMGSALTACFIPAQRATRVDPLITLRDA